MSEFEGRDRILNYLNSELIGPKRGSEEIISGTVPSQRYTMGVLFPQAAALDEVLEDEKEDEKGGSVGEEVSEDPVAMSGQWMPSSIGVTFFFADSQTLEVEVSGAAYGELENDTRAWKRIPIAESNSPEQYSFSAPAQSSVVRKKDALNGRAEVNVHWRALAEGYLVTVTLLNVRHAGDSRPDPGDCLYQVGLACSVPDGTIREYPDARSIDLTEREEEMRIIYRDAKTYAIGHGCAADWKVEEDTVDRVCTKLMPEYEVKPVTHTSAGDQEILRISRLADPDQPIGQLGDDLRNFVAAYEGWIEGLPSAHSDILGHLTDARDRILDRLRETARRMRRGIKKLEEDPVVLRAFRLANRAMLMQMHHGKVYEKRRVRNSFDIEVPDYSSLTGLRWYPFQLAYQLLTLDSIADDSSDYRDVVDLIWFPTGGGKTEAYLAVAAFQIFLRRLRHGNAGAGTTVITRYTLRLLTSQQFERSSRLICACELLRQEKEEEMGDEPITIGLWAGQSMSPNKHPVAAKLYEDILEHPSPSNPFQLEQCPWCGTELIPRHHVEDEDAYGIQAGNRSFEMYCPSEECAFHDGLPVSVVDADLYRHPPAFLIATVDKFARLAWIADAGVFFGTERFRPPSLVIQDELHLLSGPLGTTAGIYESAIEGLMEMKGIRPKVIASTATIRSAEEQVTGLFGNDVRLFPSPGLSDDDSYFARTDYDSPGRLYVGVLSSNHRPTTSLIRTAAGLQQAPIDCPMSEAEKDAYWTLVIYHNSLRELGKTVTFARDDIPARTRVIAEDEATARELTDYEVLELTSNLSDAEIPESFSRLKLGPDEEDSVSIAACTSMFSVGVDIQRLGLMMVNGQPKTTSQYIQASSRVGRGDIPGLVVMHYAANKPRDRSHYESFIPYHAALYRNVEPTSVTPFSLPSRERALHAALVIMVRHGVGLSENEDAGRFDRNDLEIRRAIDLLERAVSRMEPDEREDTRRQLHDLAEEWHRQANDSRNGLYYNSSTRSRQSLLRNFGESKEGWATLHSMRNVDMQCEIQVVGENQ